MAVFGVLLDHIPPITCTAEAMMLSRHNNSSPTNGHQFGCSVAMPTSQNHQASMSVEVIVKSECPSSPTLSVNH
jgi:hypothetical protein